MNKTYLIGLVILSTTLVSCGNRPTPEVKGNVTVVAAPDTETADYNIRFSESNVKGQISIQSRTPQKEVTFIPEKATAICNDGTFSMSLLNEACLNNAGVKEAIQRYYSE